MKILKGVIRKSLIIILPAMVVSAFFAGWRLPTGIMAGGVLGILNLRGLARNVEAFIGSEKTTAKIIFSSMARLFSLFVIIFAIVYFKIVNVFGLLFGFTVVFIFILIEGMKAGKKGEQ